jgi:hypothetical protein
MILGILFRAMIDMAIQKSLRPASNLVPIPSRKDDV